MVKENGWIMVHFTIGIAGHIDHGKTTLTMRLTGMDTDTRKEEKEREISIETGFAHFKLPNGEGVGVVDVPGHERFIRQMIAGVAGIDLVLLVIAADEGVMPQTREHLDILRLLGMENGMIVLNKVDLADSDWLEMVEEEIRREVKGTFLENAPIVRVSAKTGAGIPLLVDLIARHLSKGKKKESEPVRLPIDRVFSVKGVGTVVTGTLFEGRITPGMRLRLLPQDKEVRVRQLQVHHQNVERAAAGDRTALNLSGVEKKEIRRGNVLVEPDFLESTTRIDLKIKILDGADLVVRHRSRLFLYTGTSEVEGILLFFDREEAFPGEELYGQVLLKEPVAVKRDDRVILRRPTPALTFAGGRVIYAYGKKYRFRPETVMEMRKEDLADPEERILSRLSVRAMSGRELYKDLTLPPEQVYCYLSSMVAEGILFSTDKKIGPETYFIEASLGLRQMERVTELLNDYHRENSSQEGMKRSELKEKVGKWPDPFYLWLVERLIQEGRIREEGERLALAEFTVHLPEKLAQKADEIYLRMEREGQFTTDWPTLVAEMGLKPQEGEEIMAYLIHAGKLKSLSEKICWARETWERSLSILRQRAEKGFTLQEAKDILGVSRKYLIPFLERLDREGITTRQGEVRCWRK